MSWGNRLLLVFIVFASGMAYLVYRSRHVNYELVEKDYYKSELRYQQIIDGSSRVNQLNTEVRVTQDPKRVAIQLPAEFVNASVSGDIWFYCGYDETRDRKFPLQVDTGGKQLFKKGSVLPGTYNIKISWTSNGKFYYAEKPLILK